MMLEFRVVDPASDDARHCLDNYFAVLLDRFDEPFERGRTNEVQVAAMTPPNGYLMLGYSGDRAVACGALKKADVSDVADIKHVWVDTTVRGQRVGSQLMDALELLAVEKGFTAVRLDTNRNLTEAISMYRRRGYEEVAAFNDEFYAHHWFIKTL